MKKSALYLLIIILLLLWCAGCSQRVLPQSVIEAKTVSFATSNTNESEATVNPNENEEWKAYRSILSGNFTLINEDDSKKEMNCLFS